VCPFLCPPRSVRKQRNQARESHAENSPARTHQEAFAARALIISSSASGALIKILSAGVYSNSLSALFIQ
jgi:hypothetical protein